MSEDETERPLRLRPSPAIVDALWEVAKEAENAVVGGPGRAHETLVDLAAALIRLTESTRGG